jgi:hypothetical protein
LYHSENRKRHSKNETETKGIGEEEMTVGHAMKYFIHENKLYDVTILIDYDTLDTSIERIVEDGTFKEVSTDSNIGIVLNKIVGDDYRKEIEESRKYMTQVYLKCARSGGQQWVSTAD